MSELLVVVAATVLSGAVAVMLWAARRRRSGPGAAARTGWRSSVTAPVWGRRIGIIAGLCVAVAACTSGPLETGKVLAAPLFGLTVLLGVLGGELAVAGPRGRNRTAELAVRRSWHYLPATRTGVVTAASGVLLGLLAITAATGAADDLGRGGRAFTAHCPAQHLTQTAGPWPGTFYAVPLGALVIAGLAAAAFTLHHVTRRPRLADPSHPGCDDQARRRSADVIVAAVGIMVATSLAGVCAVCAVTISDLTCRPAHASSSVWGLTLMLLASLALLLSCVHALAAPSRPAANRPTVFAH